MCKLVITEPGLRLRRMMNGCVRKDQEVKSDSVWVLLLILTQVLFIIIIIILLLLLLLFNFQSVCSKVYTSYLVVGILTNYYDFLLGDRLNILFSNPSPHTYMLLNTVMLLKSVH
jgi:hypothetical protein